MAVERVRTGHGSHVQPDLNYQWDDLTKLRWHAGVVSVDTGLLVEVFDAQQSTLRGGVWVPDRGLYTVCVTVPGSSSSSSGRRFNDAWTYLSGIATGAEATRDAPRVDGNETP